MEKHFKKLGKLSLAILEHFVEDKLGKEFVDELYAPTKRTLAVATALERTQDRFIKGFEDKIFSENFLIKTSKLSLSIQAETVGKFYDHPTDPVFSKILQFVVTDNFPSFPVERIERGVEEYITILTEELVQVDETFRQNASALAIVRSERWQKQILDTLSKKQKAKVDQGDLWTYLPSDMAAIIEKIRESSLEFYTRHISEYFPDYIQHSLDHPDRAMNVLNNWLLDEEQKQYLANNSWTLFFLYASVYLYNIGLSSVSSMEFDELTANSRKTLLSVRAKRGQLIIEKFWGDLGIEDKLQASILSIICLACQETRLEDTSIKRRIPYKQTGQTINLQFIVGCVKLLHELDLNQTRLPFLFERFLSEKEEISSAFEFGGIGPDGNDPDTISVFVRCNNMNIHRALKSLEGHTQTLISEVNRNINPRFKFTQIVYDIENIGYEPIDYKFKVEMSAALEVFMGTSIYAHKATFLRELIQNCLDACNVRRMYSSSLYTPKISIERKPDHKTIVVRDNGIGMDKNWVEKYFLPIGISFYRSEEFENIASLDMGFSPISRFGIGILSCFMVADKVVVRTKKLNTVGLELTVSDFRNYFEVKQDNLLEQGTEIILTLKPEFANIDCLGYLLENIKFTQEPIEYVYFNGEKRVIGQEPVSLIENLKINFWKKEWANYIEEAIPFSSPTTDGYIAFSKSKNREESTFSGDMSVCVVNIFQDGIFICNEPNLLPRWMKKNIVSRINLRDEDRIDISISRVSLLQNSKYLSLKSKIDNGLSLLLNNIFEVSLNDFKTRKEYNKFVKKFIKDNINVDAIDNSLAEILRKYYCFEIQRSSNTTDGYLLYEEIPNKESIYQHQTITNSRREKIQIGDEGNFVFSEDARVLLLLNPEKNYRETSLLDHNERLTIRDYLDEETFGEDDFSAGYREDIE